MRTRGSYNNEPNNIKALHAIKKSQFRPPPAPKSKQQSTKNAQEACKYLYRFENERSTWKFEKIKQIWLLKNALDSNLINDEYFEILLNYLTLLTGKAKVETINNMKSYIQNYENKYLNIVQKIRDEDDDDEIENAKIEEIKYERARQILQIINEDES